MRITKPHRIQIRITDDEKTFLESFEGKTISTVLRTALRKYMASVKLLRALKKKGMNDEARK